MSDRPRPGNTYVTGNTAGTWSTSTNTNFTNDPFYKPPPQVVGLDFETYGAVDLTVHGMHRYMDDPSFKVLLASVAWVTQDGVYITDTIDFVQLGHSEATALLGKWLSNHRIAAHNAGFEQLALKKLGMSVDPRRFIDSAVVSRAVGGGTGLEAAAPQLLDIDKMSAGKGLIRVFSIPGKYQADAGTDVFHVQVIRDRAAEWFQFKEYCELDAELSLRLVHDYLHLLTSSEMSFQAMTFSQNSIGWPVDLDLVQEMQRRYLDNQANALAEFRATCDAPDLNLNSYKQVKEWCADRGIKANSFDEKNVARLVRAINKKLDSMSPGQARYDDYCQVLHLLETKQVLGGASLKKLQTIIDTAVKTAVGFRLRDQYVHCGAGQTLRTTGRSTQMQNLKRLTEDVGVMEDLWHPDVEWDNTKLAVNMRQVFTASSKAGFLLVGDFKSVESRGLAYLAGAFWKLNEFRKGRDMYKVLAEQMFSIAYDLVDKAQRQAGKVGELACGYGAAGEAVQAFAENMGITMELAEAEKLVRDWRHVNPEVVDFWDLLNELLSDCLVGRRTVGSHHLPDGLILQFVPIDTPESLLRQHPGSQSISMEIVSQQGDIILRRIFHGCYESGRNVQYYKPSDRKTGPLWREGYTDPKTGAFKFYSLYGGKLAGILTQSFCREIFFRSMLQVSDYCRTTAGQVTLIGQFHDEMVLDWRPGPEPLQASMRLLDQFMSDPGRFKSFPLEADIKYDYRYTK